MYYLLIHHNILIKINNNFLLRFYYLKIDFLKKNVGLYVKGLESGRLVLEEKIDIFKQILCRGPF